MPAKLDHELIKSLYVKGYDLYYISEKVSGKYSTVRKVIVKSGLFDVARNDKEKLLRAEIKKSARELAYPDHLTSIQKEIITGHLLGDGSLYKGKKAANALFEVSRAEPDTAYTEWTAKNLESFLSPAGVVHGRSFIKSRDKTYYYSKMRTVSLSGFTKLHTLWYPEGVKILPASLVLTPLTLAVWYADDGYIRSNHSTKCYSDVVELKLSTPAFPSEQVKNLALLLSDRYNQKFNTYKDGKGLSIHSANKGTRAFIEEIEPVFPSCMDRKAFWKTEAFHPQERKSRRKDSNTHCKHNHEYTKENTYINNNGTKSCRECACISSKNYRQRNKKF